MKMDINPSWKALVFHSIADGETVELWLQAASAAEAEQDIRERLKQWNIEEPEDIAVELTDED